VSPLGPPIGENYFCPSNFRRHSGHNQFQNTPRRVVKFRENRFTDVVKSVNEKKKTRSTGTMHTSAEARLTSVAIRIRIPDPDCHQNLTIGLLSTFPENFMQIRWGVFAQSC